jgi:hypothetical protein
MLVFFSTDLKKRGNPRSQRIASHCSRYVMILEVMSPYLHTPVNDGSRLARHVPSHQGGCTSRCGERQFYLLLVDENIMEVPMASFRPHNPQTTLWRQMLLSGGGALISEHKLPDILCVGGLCVSIREFGCTDLGFQNTAEYIGTALGILAPQDRGKECGCTDEGDSTTAH